MGVWYGWSLCQIRNAIESGKRLGVDPSLLLEWLRRSPCGCGKRRCLWSLGYRFCTLQSATRSPRLVEDSELACHLVITPPMADACRLHAEGTTLSLLMEVEASLPPQEKMNLAEVFFLCGIH